MRELPDAPTLEVRIARLELLRHNRWNAGYFEERFRRNESKLKKLHSVLLGDFIPDELPDGSKGITYGQVGARKLSQRGGVRYLQVINIRDTGIDFAIKPDRIAEGSHNDPERSRVEQGDILITNTAFRGTETLIGRCVVVSRNYGKLNISKDIDRVRVQNINPYYVGALLKTKFGQLQIQRLVHGVDSQKINFGQVRSLLIPVHYLIHHGDVPVVTIEGEPTASQFEVGFKQAKNYSRNLKPRQRGHQMQERTVPFLITAAGSRAEMCRAVVRGLNVEYEPIRQNGLPAFLEWNELLAEAGQAQPAAVVSPQQQVLVADLAHQFFTDLFGSIDQVAALRNKDDQKIILFNRIIDHARYDGEAGLRTACRQLGLERRQPGAC